VGIETENREREADGRAPIVVVATTPEEGAPPGLERLASEASVRLAETPSELERAIPDAEILLVTDFRGGGVEHAWPLARRLRWVHATMAGVDALLFPAFAKSDIVLTNARGIFDRTIAEYVLGWIIALAKDFRGTLDLQRERRFVHRETDRIEGKRVLVVGAGAIGAEVARMTHALSMKTIGVARSARAPGAHFDAIHGFESLGELLTEADYVVIAAPLTDETRGMIDEAALAAMKPSAALINVGRGAVVHTPALVRALAERRIAHAVLDVFEEEPLPPEHPLWDLPNVVISAHMAGDFHGWRRALIDQFIENFERFRRGAPLFNQVDKERGYVPS
jgi:phosphoglycerate dehydrogenase-like enzyme